MLVKAYKLLGGKKPEILLCLFIECRTKSKEKHLVFKPFHAMDHIFFSTINILKTEFQK